MFNKVNRSVESWGPLAEEKLTDSEFNKIVNNRCSDTKTKIKTLVAKQKKLKPYKVQFVRQLCSDPYELKAESEYDLIGVARDFFKENKDTITFKTHNNTFGYDNISYTKLTVSSR